MTLDDDFFHTIRNSVFSSKYVDFPRDEALSILGCLKADEYISNLYTNSEKILVQPRGGVATVAKQQELYDKFKNVCDVLPLTIDSHTRKNNYDYNSVILARADGSEELALNGFPLINHGAKAFREVNKYGKPISLRHGTPDAKILTEVALASGISEIEGGGLSYLLPYSRDFPVIECLMNWWYVDFLCAEISKSLPFPISRESFGPLTSTLVPPYIVLIVEMLELILAAQAGVKHFSVAFGQYVNPLQDIVVAKSLRSLVLWMQMSGIIAADVKVPLVYHQWMGAFPYDGDRAKRIIETSATRAVLCGADKVITKSFAEATGVPTAQQNFDSILIVRNAIDNYNNIDVGFDLNDCFVEFEVELLVNEVKRFVDRFFNSKESTIKTIANFLERGLIDVPFSPHEANRGEMLSALDSDKMVRIVDQGSLDLSSEFMNNERSKQKKFKKIESRLNSVIEDILVFAK